jgi:hypothetical protein
MITAMCLSIGVLAFGATMVIVGLVRLYQYFTRVPRDYTPGECDNEDR